MTTFLVRTSSGTAEKVFAFNQKAVFLHTKSLTMKRHLLTILACALALSVQAQTAIVADRQENGGRLISTSNEKVCSARDQMMCVGMTETIRNEKPTYYIDIQIYLDHPENIGENRLLLMKFSDGEVMELKNQKRISEHDCGYTTSNYRTTYFMIPSYAVTNEQLQSIQTKRVVKVRVETDNDYYDYKIVGDRFSSAVESCVEAMKQRESCTKRDVHENF